MIYVIAVGARPELKILATFKRALVAKAALSGEGHITASLRWLDLRLDGPGAELHPWKRFHSFSKACSEEENW